MGMGCITDSTELVLRPPCSTTSTYLVDPASSHMLVSKTKPCMSKYKQIILRDCGRLIKTVTIYSMILLLG